jgi:hypothetical protein
MDSGFSPAGCPGMTACIEAKYKLPDGQITSTSNTVNLSIPSRKNIRLAPSGKSVM